MAYKSYISWPPYNTYRKLTNKDFNFGRMISIHGLVNIWPLVASNIISIQVDPILVNKDQSTM